ncbi:hypothetical protein AB205_0179240 [Aquarana catesbeiana]|uniref:Uncharacterized protein n=1 Tax=Aquarana catesbeiana TaxID=8400 RepID=A0A2G9QAR5_AQUCT|nr:hypothetical protein AB205_0179240 [Aquarana catesbeiana]
MGHMCVLAPEPIDTDNGTRFLPPTSLSLALMEITGSQWLLVPQQSQ